MEPSAPESIPDRLQAAFDSALAGLLTQGEEVALINFPKWGNLGDSAMWLGETGAIARTGARLRYRADSRLYRRALVSGAIGDRGTILLHGGGNIGDVYPLQHRVRKRILRDFPEARVIQLPQTIWYRNPAKGRRFGEACRNHGNFTLMVREGQSAERARDQLGLETLLAPDAAFGLGPLTLPAAPEYDVLWLLRDDRERTTSPPGGRPGHVVRDWPDKFGHKEPHARALRAALAVNSALSVPITREVRGSGLTAPLVGRTYDTIARQRLALALKTIALGRVVVTDRLHGHILCTLASVPHVVLDSASGKSRGMYETWTSGTSRIRFAEDVGEAERLAEELAAGAAQGAEAGA